MQVKLFHGLSRVSTKVLLLEDDTLLGETLLDLLEESAYDALHVVNGQEALDATYNSKFDIYLLDINVPLLDGVSLLRELRGANDVTPAIFLTSHKDKETLERGFLSGADDFITKPFDNDELLWRIEAVLKRYKQNEAIQIEAFKHDKTHKSISYKEKTLELSKKEYELLVLLLTHINTTVPKELIFDELWSSHEGGSDGAIRVYINRLKQLLPDVKIENIRSVGYKLVS